MLWKFVLKIFGGKWLNKHKSFCLHASCLAAAWIGKNNFCYVTSAQIQYYLFLQTTTNSREIPVVKGKTTKEHRVRGKREENGEKLFTKMKLRIGSTSLTQYSRKSRWWDQRSISKESTLDVRRRGRFVPAEKENSLVCQEWYCFFS